MKPFSKRDLAILTDSIISTNSSVQLDSLSRDLSKGDFKPITSEGIKKIWKEWL